MNFPPPGSEAGARSTPLEIARHELFTAREKIELLRRLKAEITAEHVDPKALGFDAEDIDKAIEEVKSAAGSGQDAEAVRRGDF
ncbi:MAG TPA: hypothetical protein VL418_04075 [Devosiaceae bacterium]|nr:hypothetical protein [Devosiaceae bacterium]